MWHLVARTQPRYLLPGPEDVLVAAIEFSGQLAMATGVTGAAALSGLVLSLTVGTATGLIFAQSRLIQRAAYPYLILVQTVPIVAIAPLVVLWFGYGFMSVVVMAFILGLFPIINNVTAGLTRVDANLLELFAIHNATRLAVLVKLRLPNAVPYLVAGARIACGLSVVGAIVGEIYAGRASESLGLGYLVVTAASLLQTDYLFAAIACSTLLGVAIFYTVSLIGATVLARWEKGDGK